MDTIFDSLIPRKLIVTPLGRLIVISGIESIVTSGGFVMRIGANPIDSCGVEFLSLPADVVKQE